ncbi:hypothetical protein BDW42DRAFT_180225 [Aspergillus taichungensis]|uniref:Uncharacterized protein n=1 Tax=Aspergillus taichungensis TaxID=482145 RepID=A0A2J5HFN8_9EURO|nr:hypothetical protein BDW42DRAFT_180225 [Aspergillus taichungensis]
MHLRWKPGYRRAHHDTYTRHCDGGDGPEVYSCRKRFRSVGFRSRWRSCRVRFLSTCLIPLLSVAIVCNNMKHFFVGVAFFVWYEIGARPSLSS